jgi:23S rRNA (guanosine2251-2'-O)-methyltransferase
MRHAPERAVALYSSLGSAELKAWIGAVASGVTVASDVDPGKLSEMVETDSHQGILAWCLREEEIPLSRYLKESDPNCPSLLVLVDSVNDPQNLGAILRAAECFGADGVIISKNRGCSITPVVTKASVGASELVRTFEVSNLAEALRLCTEHGYWGVVTALVPEAIPLATFSFPHRTVMVLGSEGTGVQSLLLRRADFTLKIEQYGMIDSLNVSQATAVLLYQYRCAHPGAKTLVCTG